MNTSQDGSESVDQFLARIASVKEGRDQASEERTRRMEEDFLKSRKERQARRLERARSLSPSKTDPSASSSFSSSPAVTRDTALNPPVDFSPRASTLSRSNAVSARTSPRLEPKRSEPDLSPTPKNPPSPTSNNTGLSRNGTLSWQQRPPRDAGLGRPRPLSTIETIRTVPKHESQEDDNRAEPTRQEIAASLATRDASWFRQTQDRGLSSAAFRKNQVEDTATVQHVMPSQELPGMSKEGSKPKTATPARENSHGAPSSQLQSPTMIDKMSREASPTPAPRALTDAPRLMPSPQQAARAEAQPESTLNGLGRTASILSRRSPSPTKGLGGFVESAMMKRSDSVNKRWSVQANAGLKRGDSVAGARPLSGIRSRHAATLSRTSIRDGSSSPVPISGSELREGSKPLEDPEPQSELQHKNSSSREEQKEAPQADKTASTAVRPKTPPNDQLPLSPSKTFDTRRWSPTKSSWLESALLSRPESPKPLPIKEEIPAWKASLQRNKASRDIKLPDNGVRSVNSEDVKPRNQPPVVAKKPDLTTKESTMPAQQKFSEIRTPAKSKVGSDVPTEEEPPAVETKTGVLEIPQLSKPEERSAANLTAEKQGFASAENRAEKRAPPMPKPKPQTPPKTDFRSTLKPRALPSTDDTKAEPEFRSMFGKLKPTQTQNYVAPDTLKTNILTGKAALNVTAGPQKTQRVDEFKESILQKKEAMKATAVHKKDVPSQEMQPTKPEPVVPEALARRKTLHKATPSITKLQNSSTTLSSTPLEQSRPAIAPKPKVLDVSGITTTPISTTRAPNAEQQVEKTTTKTSPELNAPPSSSPQVTTRSNTLTEDAQKPASENMSTKIQTVAAPNPFVPVVLEKAELAPTSKLASRFNPNLAAILSRGSSPHISTGKASSDRPTDEAIKPISRNTASQEPLSSGELTHMTKGRAKGPKRRAPKSQPEQATSSAQAKNVSQSDLIDNSMNKPTPMKTIQSLKQAFVSEPSSTITASPATTQVSTAKVVDNTVSDVEAENLETKPKPKPTIVSKSPELRKASGRTQPQQHNDVNSKSPNEDFKIASDDTQADKIEAGTAPRAPAAISKPSLAALPLTPSKSRINSSRSTQDHLSSPTKPQSPKRSTGLELSSKPSPTKLSSNISETKSKPISPRKPSTNIKVQQRSVPNQNLESILSTYFPTLPDKQQKAEFDIATLLTQAQEPSEKTKSVSHTIWEITGDGKKMSVPAHQEHILYEETMYLIIHTLETTANGKSAEAYLWCGDEVSDAATEDAQLFCRKDAREHNAKLEVVRQGKEPAKFFQALGGILIVRRSKTSSLYMLRGRRHLGHIAFDEVDFTTSNLCSGFPCLISAKFGKLYLWKGKGSGADEIGCARLIGMDLGLTGEIEEVAEGQEPASFWESFSGLSERQSWSEDWQQRAEHDCYPTTLYRVDLDRGKTTGGFWSLRAASPSKSNKANIDVISPFCSRDVDPGNIYVLDAFRTIYVLLDQQANSKTTEIVTALHLAQELAFLSPSIQGRPLLPMSYVVFGDPPPDVKICFRKWPAKVINTGTTSSYIELERVMDALKL